MPVYWKRSIRATSFKWWCHYNECLRIMSIVSLARFTFRRCCGMHIDIKSLDKDLLSYKVALLASFSVRLEIPSLDLKMGMKRFARHLKEVSILGRHSCQHLILCSCQAGETIEAGSHERSILAGRVRLVF